MVYENTLKMKLGGKNPRTWKSQTVLGKAKHYQRGKKVLKKQVSLEMEGFSSADAVDMTKQGGFGGDAWG